jgi:hypothetical protein
VIRDKGEESKFGVSLKKEKKREMRREETRRTG